MKYILTLLLGFMSYSAFSQCDFEIIDFNNKKINATPKQMFVLQENQETLTGDYVLFSLFTDGIKKELLITFSRVARHQFPKFCFEEGSFIRFIFKDGTSAKLLYNGEETCKVQQKHPNRENFKVLKIESSFEITALNISSLKTKKIKSISINGQSGANFTYEVLKKISDTELGSIYPSTFFINKLDCLEVN